jgi:hypothetical protein
MSLATLNALNMNVQMAFKLPGLRPSGHIKKCCVKQLIHCISVLLKNMPFHVDGGNYYSTSEISFRV